MRARNVARPLAGHWQLFRQGVGSRGLEGLGPIVALEGIGQAVDRPGHVMKPGMVLGAEPQDRRLPRELVSLARNTPRDDLDGKSRDAGNCPMLERVPGMDDAE